MTRSIEQWRGLEGIWPFRREIVQNFLARLDFDYLERMAQKARQTSTCKVLTNNFTSGRERIVLEIEFSDRTFWVARISLPPLPTAADDCTLLPTPGPDVMLSEIVTMQYVANKTSIPLPRVLTILSVITASMLRICSWTKSLGNLYGHSLQFH